MRYSIIPSIIAETQFELDELIDKFKNLADVIQLDVMDSKFVHNNSLNFDFELPDTECGFEAHLMVENPDEWMLKHLDMVDTVIVHVEGNENRIKILSDIARKKGKRFGIALKPETSIGEIERFLHLADQILVMTVEPGFYGSPFMQDMLEKVRQIRALKDDIDIEVDGGENPHTIKRSKDAGANLFVVGSYLAKVEKEEAEKRYKELERLINKDR